MGYPRAVAEDASSTGEPKGGSRSTNRERLVERTLTVAMLTGATYALGREASERALDVLPSSEVVRLASGARWTEVTPPEVTWRCHRDDFVMEDHGGHFKSECAQRVGGVTLTWKRTTYQTRMQYSATSSVLVAPRGQRFISGSSPSERCDSFGGDDRPTQRIAAFQRALAGDAVLLRCDSYELPAQTQPVHRIWTIGLRDHPMRAPWIATLLAGLGALLVAVHAGCRRDEPRTWPWRTARRDADGTYRLDDGTQVRPGALDGQPEIMVLLAGHATEAPYRADHVLSPSRVETRASVDALVRRHERQRLLIVAGLAAVACGLSFVAHALR